MELNFAVIDLVFALLIIAASLRGAIRGFVTEIGMMAALIVGLGGALLFTRPLARLLGEYFGDSIWNQIIAFLVIFLLIYILVKLLESLLRSLIDRLSLERLDRALGLFLGLGEGVLLVGVILFLLNWQPFFEVDQLLGSSFFAQLLFPLLPSPDRIFRTRQILNNV